MEKILIIGGGIIGGSLIKALNDNSNYELHLLDTNIQTKDIVNKLYNCQVHERIIDCPHIFLAVPINYTFEYLDKLALLNYTGTIYDCSSTKYELEQYALSLGLNFVGFHPMCGSEKTGFENSSKDLFTNKKIICSVQDDFTTTLITDLGATEVIIDCNTHDKLAAQISHLPQLISILLNDVNEDAKLIAGNGFKDMTRISTSSYNVWEPILKSNKQNIINELKALASNIDDLTTELENDNYDAISNRFINK